MFDGGRVVAGGTKEPTRKLTAEWIVGTYKAICEEMGGEYFKGK
jgi:hypothetical protein